MRGSLGERRGGEGEAGGKGGGVFHRDTAAPPPCGPHGCPSFSGGGVRAWSGAGGRGEGGDFAWRAGGDAMAGTGGGRGVGGCRISALLVRHISAHATRRLGRAFLGAGKGRQSARFSSASVRRSNSGPYPTQGHRNAVQNARSGGPYPPQRYAQLASRCRGWGAVDVPLTVRELIAQWPS